MTFILTSYIKFYQKDENENKIVQPIKNENKLVDNIKKHLKNTNRIVYVANNPRNFDENDLRCKPAFESFEVTGFNFKEKVLLDNRNRKNAKDIISGADLVILSGGKCRVQNKFFKKIKLKRLLKNFAGVVIGISAGSMNLCNIVANFPEEQVDVKEPRWFKGLGYLNEIIIPHFDGENVKYQFECEEVDLINDYVLPMSNKRDFVGLPNGSYFLIDNEGEVSVFGDKSKISNGKVSKEF